MCTEPRVIFRVQCMEFAIPLGLENRVHGMMIRLAKARVSCSQYTLGPQKNPQGQGPGAIGRSHAGVQIGRYESRFSEGRVLRPRPNPPGLLPEVPEKLMWFQIRMVFTLLFIRSFTAFDAPPASSFDVKKTLEEFPSCQRSFPRMLQVMLAILSSSCRCALPSTGKRANATRSAPQRQG